MYHRSGAVHIGFAKPRGTTRRVQKDQIEPGGERRLWIAVIARKPKCISFVFSSNSGFRKPGNVWSPPHYPIYVEFDVVVTTGEVSQAYAGVITSGTDAVIGADPTFDLEPA